MHKPPGISLASHHHCCHQHSTEQRNQQQTTLLPNCPQQFASYSSTGHETSKTQCQWRHEAKGSVTLLPLHCSGSPASNPPCAAGVSWRRSAAGRDTRPRRRRIHGPRQLLLCRLQAHPRPRRRPSAILRWVSSNRRSGAPCAAEEAKRTWSGCATMTSAPAAVPRGAGTESGDGFDLGRRLCCDPTSHRRRMSVRNQRKG
jgi:hypothetical protein